MFQLVKPIRTYGRKKEVIIPTPKLVIPTSESIENHVLSNKNINRTKNEEVDDKSLYNDPFETTFDKLLKNTRIPPPIHKVHNDTILLDSSDNKSAISDDKSSLHVVANFNTKPVSKRKINQRKPKVQVIKKTIKKKIIFQNSGKFKLQNDNAHKYKLRQTRNNSKMTSKYIDIDCINFNYDETKISEIKNYNQDKGKVCNRKSFVGKRKRDSNMPSVNSSSNMEVKPCSVNLDKSNISKWKRNAIENNLLKRICQLSNQCINTDITTNNLEHNNTSMKHCFIKLEQLEMESYKKSLNFDKKNKNVFNSTPNDRPIRSSAHVILLSPIPIGHFEKLEDSNIHASNALLYGNNEVCLGSKLIGDDLYKKSNVVEKCELEDKSVLLFNSLSNISNLSKSNLNESEITDKKNANSLTKLSCNTNVNYNQNEYFTKKDLDENNSKNGKNGKNKTILTQEHKSANTKTNKHYLRFSVDANKSRSLFDDTNENNTRVYNMEKTCNSNLAVDEKMTVLINEMQSDFIKKLDEKSTLNVNYDKEVIFNKIEKLPDALIPINLTTSDSSGDITIELKSEQVNNKSNEIVDDVSCKILSHSKSILNTNNSFGNSCMKYDILPSYVVLEQLQDPIRVTKRKKYTKWDLDLVSIPEDCKDGISQRENRVDFKESNSNRQMLLSQKKLSVFENIMEESINNGCITIKKAIYLKPGKSWARSLSIINNIQTDFNLDKLSVGKGKKWRHSVQDILNMQTQGIIQSCMKKNDNDKKLPITNELINKSDHELINNKGRTYDSINLSRVSRRISVRVVPNHKTVKSIEDASFLEVYGIVPIKSQKFTLLNNPQKSFTCNIQSDIDQIIAEHIVSTGREVILQRCLQKDYIPFSLYFSDSYLQHCRKIGEGVYGEVFLYEQENKKSVIKIIPIEGNDYVNGEPQKKFHEILSEIVIAMELHNLRFNTKYNTDGFVEVKNIKCTKGKYPEKLLELWNIYDEEKHSDNDCPSMFNDDQLYIVLELEHGGQDLEAFVFNTAVEAYILFIQAALALAVAEKAVEFEHRDLHWGNILISPTNKAYVHYKLGQKNIELVSKGVKVSIIDFTLSRVQYQGCSIFNDLASDPTLFTAQGEYQFEIYRLMKNKVKNNWQIFEPYTNILWLHYTLDKMITAVRYKKRNLKIHKNGIIKLKELKNEILKYNSAFDLITNCHKIVNLLHVDA